MKKLVLIAIITLFCSSAFSDGQLDKLKAIYKNEMRGIDVKYAGKDDIQKAYLERINIAFNKAAEKGDVEVSEKIDAEKKRFESEKTIPATPVHDISVKDIIDKTDLNKNTEIVELSDKYIKYLEPLKVDLLKAKDIKGASAVQAEINRVKPIVNTAKFIVADLSSKVSVKPISNNQLDSSRLPSGLRKGLVLHYDFDKNEDKKVIDKSSYGNHGVVYGAKWRSSRGGRKGVMEFDGKDDYITAPHRSELAPTEAITIHALVYCKSNKSQYGRIISKSSSSLDYDYFIQLKGDFPQFGLNRSNWVNSNKKLQFGQWVGYTAVYTGAEVLIYIDSEVAVRNDWKANISRQATDIQIGRLFSDGKAYYDFQGELDDIMIWSRALSENEVKQLYKMTGGK